MAAQPIGPNKYINQKGRSCCFGATCLSRRLEYNLQWGVTFSQVVWLIGC